jgi:glycosyltransferase involved in cell wall biosynthesis
LALYRDADIFVLPTRADLHSIAGLEAMAMGLPVISTTVGGIIDIYINDHNGLTIPVDDEGALAEALRKLVYDPELRRRLGANARKTVEEKFDLEKNARTIVEYLKQAAGRSGS